MLKVRLALMNFLEFAVWGAYLTCMGMYLGRIGMADHIGSFYAMQGFVSILSFLKKAVDLFVTMCYNSITISLEVSPWLKKMKF